MSASNQISILFVCMGNICRSPAGECVLRHIATEKEIDGQFRFDSCGTINYHTGNKPDARMREAAQRRGITIEGSARQVRAKDLEDFDLILAADNDNLQDLLALPTAEANRDKIHLFCDYAEIDSHQSVPDPYYGGAAGFELVLDLLEEGSERVLEKVAR